MAALDRLDAGLLAVEKRLVASVLSTMGTVVFSDVMQRTLSGRGPAFLVGWIGASVGVGLLASAWQRDRSNLLVGGAVGGAVGAALLALPWLFPNGLVWSQPLALALTLWLGTLGASIAAHERRHLALDIGSKLWPPSVAPKAAAVGHLATAAFCVLLLWLSVRSVEQHFTLWSDTEGAAATLSGTAIPKWFAAAAIPYGMLVLTFRFGLEAVKAWTGAIAVGGDDTLHQLGIQEPR